MHNIVNIPPTIKLARVDIMYESITPHGTRLLNVFAHARDMDKAFHLIEKYNRSLSFYLFDSIKINDFLSVWIFIVGESRKDL